MVATRLLEVTTKGSEWVNSKSTTPGSPRVSDSSSNAQLQSSKTNWSDATTSLQEMASNTIESMVSSFYGGGKCKALNQITGLSNFHPVLVEESQESATSNSFFSWWNWNANASAPNASGNSRYYNDDNADGGTDYEDDDDVVLPAYFTPRTAVGGGFQPNHRRRSSILAYSNSNSPWQRNNNKNATPHSDLVWMFRNNKNPYNAVRGRETQLSSFTAVRSLVALVTATMAPESNKTNEISPTILSEMQTEHEDNEAYQPYNFPKSASSAPPPPPPNDLLQDTPKSVSTPSETASQLAEGTIRALRDIALEEAVDLQAALRYWNYRWERPLLSWLEAGPFGMCCLCSNLHFCDSHFFLVFSCYSFLFLVWTSPQGYNHQEIGRKVSQIQAVLARRCAAVGELQQHLLRAGWHRGVAQWGGTVMDCRSIRF